MKQPILPPSFAAKRFKVNDSEKNDKNASVKQK